MALTNSDVDQGWEITHPEHKRVYLKAEHLLRTRQNTIHARICYHYALELLQREGGDPQLVALAVLLHDVGYSKIPEEQLLSTFGPHVRNREITRFHEIEGAKLARGVLQALAYPESLIEEVVSIIDGHDTRETALNLNDMIVKDSDKLWRFNGTGFAIDFKRFNLDPRERLHYIKVRIPTWFFTETAKHLAATEAVEREKELQ